MPLVFGASKEPGGGMTLKDGWGGGVGKERVVRRLGPKATFVPKEGSLCV